MKRQNTCPIYYGNIDVSTFRYHTKTYQFSWLRNNFLLGLLGITLFSFAHVIIRLSAFSAVAHLLHTLQKQYDF